MGYNIALLFILVGTYLFKKEAIKEVKMFNISAIVLFASICVELLFSIIVGSGSSLKSAMASLSSGGNAMVIVSGVLGLAFTAAVIVLYVLSLTGLKKKGE